MKFFMIIFLFIQTVKSLSLEKARGVFLAVSPSFPDTQNVPTQSNTMFVNSHTTIADNKASVVQDNKSLTGGNTEQIKGRSNDPLETPVCSTQGQFNLTLAIQKGIEFQSEFCSRNCKGNSSADTIETTRKCLSTQPSCALCRCDDNCSVYGDCCDVTPRNVFSNGTNSTEATVHQPFICFPADMNTAVYIIASCPGSVKTSSEELGRPNYSSNSDENVSNTLDLRMDQVIEADLKCQSCLSEPESIHLITSNMTGLTYCNDYCLICNEERSVDESDLKWREMKSCRAGNDKIQNNSQSFIRNNDFNTPFMTGNRTIKAPDTGYDCKVSFQRPEAVSARECDRKIHGIMIRTCSSNLVGSMCNLSSDLLDQMQQLCQNFRSPVYTEDMVYQNIFCYLCKNKVPVSCFGLRPRDDVGRFEDININLSLLTDLSNDYFKDQKDHIGHEDIQPADINPENEQITLQCQHGYWRDKEKVRFEYLMACCN